MKKGIQFQEGRSIIEKETMTGEFTYQKANSIPRREVYYRKGSNLMLGKGSSMMSKNFDYKTKNVELSHRGSPIKKKFFHEVGIRLPKEVQL